VLLLPCAGFADSTSSWWKGAQPLIAAQEQQQGFKYEWVARTRPDSYWVGPAPALHTLDPRAYTYPEGSRFRGMNDRFSIGKRRVAEGLLRLSLLGELEKQNIHRRKHNSERALKAQLEILHIRSRALPMPFCTPQPPASTEGFVPAFDIGSTGPLSGAKCRPCNPELTGQEAIAARTRPK